MSRRQPPFRSSVTLAGWTLAIAAGITVAAASTVSALTLPAPTPPTTPVAPALPGTSGTSGLVGQVTAPLASSLGGATTSSPSGSATGLPALPSASSSSLGAVGSGVKSALATAKARSAGTPLAPVVPGSGPGGVLDLAVNASPLATACLQVTGSGTAVANTTVTVGGQNVSAPLVQALPGLLAPCPSGSVPSTPGLDASVPGLVGACVRVTPQPPLHASLLVLDRELVSTLTRVGVPLQQAVVPCPAGTAQVVGEGATHPGSGTATHSGGAKATTARPAGSHGAAGNAACASGASNGGSDGSSIDARTTAASILPHNAPQALPWALLVLALVGRRRLGQMVGALRSARTAR